MSAQFPWPQQVRDDVVAAFQQLQQLMAGYGIAIGIANYGGFRTLADTREILDIRQQEYDGDRAAGVIPPSLSVDDYRPIAPYGHSYHDTGDAFDIRIKPGGLPAGMTSDDAFAIAGRFADTIGMRWGGVFQNADPRHFERPVTLAQARADYQATTGQAIDLGAAGATGSSSAMGLADDDVGDDSGEAGIQLALEQQEDVTTGWILAGVAMISGLVIILRLRP